MSKRAYTLVELLVVMAITSVVVGTLGVVFGFAAKRADHAMSESLVLAQVVALNEDLENTISNAVHCQLRSNANGSALSCVMPTAGNDRDSDGQLDQYGTGEMGPTSVPKYGIGKRVTYYWADSTGDPSAATATGDARWLWKAWRNDDAIPTTSDKDDKFAQYTGTSGSRWNLIHSLTFSVNQTDNTVTYNIVANKLTRANRRSGTETADSRQLTLSRTVNYMRNMK